MDECVTALMKELVRFQDRLYQKDPMKARMKRRIVMGLREVLKHLKLRKIKCVVISPNCERIQSKGAPRLHPPRAVYKRTVKDLRIRTTNYHCIIEENISIGSHLTFYSVIGTRALKTLTLRFMVSCLSLRRRPG